ncbi:MAG: glucoamylase family protein [Novosphingobium sp.]
MRKILRNSAGLAALVVAGNLAAGPGEAPLAPRVSNYERHVVFDNARVEGPWYYSQAEVVAPSKLELNGGKLSIDASRYHSAPNAIRIAWTSNVGGGWWASLDARKMRSLASFEGDSLTFWVWSDNELTQANAPRLMPSDTAGQGLPAIDMTGEAGRIPARTWTKVVLPFRSFAGMARSTEKQSFDVAKLRSLVFVQGLDDGQPHQIWIDDIRVEDAVSADRTAPAAPSSLLAKGYDRHVDLSWAASRGDDVESYRIYRAQPGGPFEQVAIQRGDRTRYEDFLGASDVSARYRITAIDTAGNESAPTASVKAATHPLDDAGLLQMVQEAEFRYYWDGAQPDSGMALEVTPGDPDQIALGSSGWGVNAIVVGASRGFVTRQQALDRVRKITGFLDRVPRFHGVWPHFIDGRTAQPMAYFGPYDDGGDLVETAFMIQGLLAARQFFDRDTPAERELRATITRLWEGVEWDWYRQRPDSPFLYWHWSEDHGFYINHPLIGWNETGIVYFLAIASPTHPVPASMWYSGWAGQNDTAVKYRQGWSRTTQGDHYTNGNSYYGQPLQVGEGSGAELFFPQFVFMGLDPRSLKDGKADYFANSRAMALIAQSYAKDNPRGCKGYGASAWGRSAGINAGGGRSLPVDDNCTLVVHASIGMMPFTPAESMAALKHYYRDLGKGTWGIYGFTDSFSEQDNLFDEHYMALNQAPTVAMIENYRTGLIWKLFMKNPEVGPALKAIEAASTSAGAAP